jgi:hypothetical protein
MGDYKSLQNKEALPRGVGSSYISVKMFQLFAKTDL